METLSNQEILAAFGDGLGEWRKLGQPIATRYRVPDLAAGAVFVSAVAESAVAAGHDPEIRLGSGFVDVSLSSAVGSGEEVADEGVDPLG